MSAPCILTHGVLNALSVFAPEPVSYTHLDVYKRQIMCAVKPGQLGPLRRMVREIDPKSFLIVGDARTIYGHGFESIEED